jgi:hypothetical protein
MQLRTSQPSIIWRQVWGLSAMLAAVMFSWMAYSLYQPKILQELGFVKMAAWLGIIQGESLIKSKVGLVVVYP